MVGGGGGAALAGRVRASRSSSSARGAHEPTDGNFCHFPAPCCQTTRSNPGVLPVFTTKPHILLAILAEVAPPEHISVSMVAGVSVSTLEELLSPTQRASATCLAQPAPRGP